MIAAAKQTWILQPSNCRVNPTAVDVAITGRWKARSQPRFVLGSENVRVSFTYGLPRTPESVVPTRASTNVST
jgi:hypothetical protein